jgi:hypothetical protein
MAFNEHDRCFATESLNTPHLRYWRSL